MSVSTVQLYLIAKLVCGAVIIALIAVVGFKFVLPKYTKNTDTQHSIIGSTSPLPSAEKSVDELVKEKFGDKAAIVGSTVFNVAAITKKSQLSNGLSIEKAQGEFYIIGIVAQNIGKETETVNSSMFTLIDDQQRRYDPSPSAAFTISVVNTDLKPFLFTQVQPGLPTDGFVVFDIPPEASHLQLAIKQDFSTDEKLIPLDSLEQAADEKAIKESEANAQQAEKDRKQDSQQRSKAQLDACLQEVSNRSLADVNYDAQYEAECKRRGLEASCALSDFNIDMVVEKTFAKWRNECHQKYPQ